MVKQTSYGVNTRVQRWVEIGQIRTNVIFKPNNGYYYTGEYRCFIMVYNGHRLHTDTWTIDM